MLGALINAIHDMWLGEGVKQKAVVTSIKNPSTGYASNRLCPLLLLHLYLSLKDGTISCSRLIVILF